MKLLHCRSYAKINLGLEIAAKRSDGYHEIRTIFQTISLFDRMTVASAKNIEIFCDHPQVPDDRTNLVYKAAILLQETVGIKTGARFTIEKNIPVQSGLGGGSSNAAVALMALKKLWHLDIEENELREIALKLGADVPFFFTGGSAFAAGIGEIIDSIPYLGPAKVLIAFPKTIRISTADAYKNAALHLTKRGVTNTIFSFVRGEKDFSSLTNDFEVFLFSQFPLLRELKTTIFHLGALISGVTGSGSAVYGWFPVGTDIQELIKGLESSFPSVDFISTTPMNREEYHRTIFETAAESVQP